MKKILLSIALGLSVAAPAAAQWSSYNTHRAISGIFGIAEKSIESAERKKEMEILARQKTEFQSDFQDAMQEAKAYEAKQDWENALDKYEEAATLNCKYEYIDQRSISNKITNLYVKAGREVDGPSPLNNAKTILADYSGYRYVRENPIYKNKRAASTKMVRVACSAKETRLEFECESTLRNDAVYIKGSSYVKGNKGGKLSLVSVENITMAPVETYIPWPYQKLRFALIFEPLPEDATEFDFIEPSSEWKYKEIKCR